VLPLGYDPSPAVFQTAASTRLAWAAKWRRVTESNGHRTCPCHPGFRDRSPANPAKLSMLAEGSELESHTQWMRLA